MTDQKFATEAAPAATPYEMLETHAREAIQALLQRMLEEEVEVLLGPMPLGSHGSFAGPVVAAVERSLINQFEANG